MENSLNILLASAHKCFTCSTRIEVSLDAGCAIEHDFSMPPCVNTLRDKCFRRRGLGGRRVLIGPMRFTVQATHFMQSLVTQTRDMQNVKAARNETVGFS